MNETNATPEIGMDATAYMCAKAEPYYPPFTSLQSRVLDQLSGCLPATLSSMLNATVDEIAGTINELRDENKRLTRELEARALAGK